VRQVILDATRRLLDEHRFDELSVADILAAAQVSRGSFYFYFAGKHQVLAELVRQVVDQGHEAAQPWLADESETDQRQALRHGISEGARLWQAQAPVLRAIVENWRSDPELTTLWLEQMAGFTAATVDRIDPEKTENPAALASALTWLGERLYYLAALNVPPFDDQDTLVDTLTHIWMTSLYADPE
jgi:AcrR family transcriptional regulator